MNRAEIIKAAQEGRLEGALSAMHAEAEMQERISRQGDRVVLERASSFIRPSSVKDPENFDEFSKWNSSQVAGYVEQQGVKAGDAFIDHNIDGSIVHLLNEHHFENMGIKAVGDVIRLMLIFEKLKNMQKINHREKALWEQEEYIMSDMCQLMCCKFACCCFMCLEKGDSYKLTPINLRIRQKKPVTCCFANVRGSMAAIVRSCTGTEYANNNVDLRQVKDIDTRQTTLNCCLRCCGISGTDEVAVTAGGEEIVMRLRTGQGEAAAALIRNAIADLK